MWTAFLGRSPADRGFCYGHWPALGAFPVAWARGRGPAGARVEFTVKLKQARFDRTGTPKSPQQACQPMNERKLDHGSRINTADEDTLESSVGSNVFEIANDGLVSKPTTPSAAA